MSKARPGFGAEYSVPLPPAKTKELASAFDRLVDSNLLLASVVGRLVKLGWGILAFNAILLAAVIVVTFRNP